MLVIIALERRKQNKVKFEVSLVYIVSLRPTKAAQSGLCINTTNKQNLEKSVEGVSFLSVIITSW